MYDLSNPLDLIKMMQDDMSNAAIAKTLRLALREIEELES
jgi:hypothetical protein